MKTIIAASLVTLSFLALPAQAAMDPQLENTLIDVCKAGASNKTYSFNDTMKIYRINKTRIFPRLMCNGESFHQFALSNNADKTARLIAPYTQGKVTIQDIAFNYSADEIYDIRY
jgi:hypothetical protein